MTGFSRHENGEWVGGWELPMDPFLEYAEEYLIALVGCEVVVACENFLITVNTAKKSQGDRQWSLEQIGVLRHLCHKHGHGFELTTPSDAKTFCSNDKLRRAGFWTPGKGHANDSARQIAMALARRGIVVGMS